MRASSVFLAATTCLGLSACAGSTPYSGLAAKVYDSAQRQYACPAERVTVRTLRRNTFLAQACGDDAVFQCHAGNWDCSNLTRLAQNRARAEFRCTGSVRAREISPYVFAVEGCGNRQINYQCEMQGGIARCAAERAR